MSRPANTIVLLPSANRTTNFTGSEVINIEGYTAARIFLDIGGTVSGTSPTLDVYIQNGIRQHGSATSAGDKAVGALKWNDFAHFTQATTSSTSFFIGVVGGGNFANASQDAALGAATIRNGPLGSYWRVKGAVGGTNPVFSSVSVVAELIP